MRSWLVKMEIQVMLMTEGEWNLVTDWKQWVQQFGDGRALTWSGNQESCDGGIRCMWGSGFEGTGVRRKGRNEKKGSPCEKEWTIVVKAQGTEENKQLLLSVQGYFPSPTLSKYEL